MGIFTSSDRKIAGQIGGLGLANPFLEKRIDMEKEILHESFVPLSPVWQVDLNVLDNNPNVVRIQAKAEQMGQDARKKLTHRGKVETDELEVYLDLVLYVLYYKYEKAFFEFIIGKQPAPPNYQRFKKDVVYYLNLEVLGQLNPPSAAHLYALFFTLRRGFHYTFRHILGASMASARLRATVWESIVTHDVKRFMRSLHGNMHTIATLVTGPSGTGKELVASAIGLSRHIPFDETKGRFVADFRSLYLPVNLSAMAPSIIEGELFGYAKGAFTGAVKDTPGLFEERSALSTIFLDEIGDLNPEIQVKLLRLLQTGDFLRLGDRNPRKFEGKVVTATNRCLAEDMQQGRFRTDLYYRLCSDLVVTPSLADQIQDNPAELQRMVHYVAEKLTGLSECESLASQTLDWIESSLDKDYPWPGNMRELEQCVRNILVRGSYTPLTQPQIDSKAHDSTRAINQGQLSADELLAKYCILLYKKNGSYSETGRILGLDRRTVKSKIEWHFK